jgi:hypothetical protein
MTFPSPEHEVVDESRPSAGTLSRRSVLRGSIGATGIGLISAIQRSDTLALSQVGPTAAVSVFPRHRTETASPETEISFRGLPIEELGLVEVSGNQSGGHSGVLVAHADGRGASYVPDAPFLPAEVVTVTAGVPLEDTNDGSVMFTVAQLGNLPEIPTSRDTENVDARPQSFRSRTDLRPPVITITDREAEIAPGHIFVGAKTQQSQNGPMIVDNDGNIVWFSPLALDISSVNDVRVQEFQGQPVITWWEGVSQRGQGYGHFVIVDSAYQQVADVQAGNGFPGADLHEFLITPRGTACIIVYNPVIWDLTSVGGPSTGTVVDSIVQELEIASGRVLFEWHSLDHIGLDESIVELPEDASQAFDYVHVNSIELDDNDDFVLSARNTSAVYKIDRLSGEVAWRLNGTHSSFEHGDNTVTAYHHDARLRPGGGLTLFDNASSDEDSGMQSRGVELGLDTEMMTATLLGEYTHPTNILSVSQGNMQTLPNGNRFIGWGSAPVFSEFSPDGALVFSGRFPQFVNSYRAYRFPWIGTPADAPALAVTRRSAGSVTLFASWNGATEVSSWRFLAGDGPDQLQPLDVVARDGFETRTTVRATAQYFAAQAEDSAGQVLGISPTIQAEA